MRTYQYVRTLMFNDWWSSSSRRENKGNIFVASEFQCLKFSSREHKNVSQITKPVADQKNLWLQLPKYVSLLCTPMCLYILSRPMWKIHCWLNNRLNSTQPYTRRVPNAKIWTRWTCKMFQRARSLGHHAAVANTNKLEVKRLEVTIHDVDAERKITLERSHSWALRTQLNNQCS